MIHLSSVLLNISVTLCLLKLALILPESYLSLTHDSLIFILLNTSVTLCPLKQALILPESYL